MHFNFIVFRYVPRLTCVFLHDRRTEMSKNPYTYRQEDKVQFVVNNGTAEVAETVKLITITAQAGAYCFVVLHVRQII